MPNSNSQNQTTYLFRPPEWHNGYTTCSTFKYMRWQMQKYKYTCDRLQPPAFSGRYEKVYNNCLKKSRSLAKEMKQHARTCKVCIREKELHYVDFYGVG